MQYARLLQLAYFGIAMAGCLSPVSASVERVFSVALTCGIFFSFVIGALAYFEKGWRWGLGAGIVLPISLLITATWLGGVQGFCTCVVLAVPTQIYLSARAFGLPVTPLLLALTAFTAGGIALPLDHVPGMGLCQAIVAALGLGIFVAITAPRNQSPGT